MWRSIYKLDETRWNQLHAILEKLEKCQGLIGIEAPPRDLEWLTEIDIEIGFLGICLFGVIVHFLDPMGRIKTLFEQLISRRIHLEPGGIGHSASSSEVVSITCTAPNCRRNNPCANCQDRMK